MDEAQGCYGRSDTPAEPLDQRAKIDSSDNGHPSGTAKAVSESNQALFPIIFFQLGLLYIGACIGMIVWLALHGPALVPQQDTRITAIIISVGSRLAGLFISAAFARSAWAAFLQQLLTEEPIQARALIAVCRNFMSLGQLGDYNSLPIPFRCHIFLAVLISLAMSATSASFRYASLGLAGRNTALVPDVASLCSPSFVSGTAYYCPSALNTNTSRTSWDYLKDVYTGGQRTVYRYGEQGDKELGANVTLGILPAGWNLNDGSDLPWMTIWATCRDLPISATFTGDYISALTSIIVNDSLVDILDVFNMPDWDPVVHLYQQSNGPGPISNLNPFIAVMLAQSQDDGTASLRGLAPDAVTYLGEGYLDLHGQGAVPQRVLGAAAWCEFNGSTGGRWPDVLWPPLNHTSNVVLGTVIDDQPTMGTAMLNFGPGWQYNQLSGDSLPGGSVSYIANITGPGVSFPTLFTSYVRNQWALMAYSIAPQSGQKIALPFIGSGPDQLYISLTLVTVLPFAALVIGLLVTLRASICTIRQRRWVNRVEFESWWLIKALRHEIYKAEYCNATERSFIKVCEDSLATYRKDGGHLEIREIERTS
jgi:hypothetical protein